MGAFMIITFILLPFYPNISPEFPRPTPPFLSFVIFWDAPGTDIDLHIVETAPDGAKRHFSFSRHNREGTHFAASPAQLSVDVTRGPGVEIWETPKFRQGMSYRFYHHYYGRRDGAQGRVAVSGRLYHGEGYHEIEPRWLDYTATRSLQAVVDVSINQEGRVEARAADRSGPVNAREL